MVEDKGNGTSAPTQDSLTTGHLKGQLDSDALTLTVSHLQEMLTSESLTTTHYKNSLNRPAAAQAQAQSTQPRNDESRKK
jgi:hypothetical protein